MATQNYSNHRQFVPIFHYVLVPILFLTLIGSIVNLTQSWGNHDRLYSAALLVVLTLALLVPASVEADRSIDYEEQDVGLVEVEMSDRLCRLLQIECVAIAVLVVIVNVVVVSVGQIPWNTHEVKSSLTDEGGARCQASR